MKESKRECVLRLLNKSGVLRPRDLQKIGVSGTYLNKLHADGVVERVSRGLYTKKGSQPSERRTMAEASKRVPRGTICLLSALQFHGLTTEAPFEIWMAIDEKSRAPCVSYPPLRIVRFSGQALAYGVEKHEIDGVVVPIYSPSKTVADCFKYRNKIGLDVAIEALRDALRQRKATRDQLWTAAKVCRMANVMRPYLEAVT